MGVPWSQQDLGEPLKCSKDGGSEQNRRYARPNVRDLGHEGVNGDCDVEVVREVLES